MVVVEEVAAAVSGVVGAVAVYLAAATFVADVVAFQNSFLDY